MKRSLIFGVVVVSACSGPDPQSTQIAVPANDLGVVALQLDHFDEAGNAVTVVRGVSASGDEIALVRRISGTLPEVARASRTSGGIGSKITMSAGGTESTLLTTNDVVRIDPATTTETIARFLVLPTVTSVLARESHISVFMPTGGADHPYFTWTCSSSSLLVSPYATQCCEDETKTVFVRPSDGYLIYRWRGMPCTMQDGSSCDSDNCYYGPYGFARADMYPPGGYPHTYINNGFWPPESARCAAAGYPDPQTPIFGDVQGSNQPAGCPSSGTASAYSYD